MNKWPKNIANIMFNICVVIFVLGSLYLMSSCFAGHLLKQTMLF